MSIVFSQALRRTFSIPVRLIGSVMLIAGVFVVFAPHFLSAATPAELRAQIEEHNKKIEALEKDIAQFQSQLNQVGKEKQTLTSALNQLDLSRKKITSSVSLAQNQIDGKTLEIEELERDIGTKQLSIESGQSGLAESIRRMNEAETQSLVLMVLGADSLAAFWNDASTLAQFQSSLNDQINALETVKVSLETTKAASVRKQAELIAHKNELRTQQRALDVNRQEQQSLLNETKNKESNYQKLLAEKQAAKAQFEKALQDFEAELQYTLDPSSIPTSGSVFRWPLDSVRITQYFGNTAFAQSGAYNGSGHNGIDLAASIGTPLKAALAGTVQGTGNTDAYKGCYSYGKWVLIRHANGLSTLYAHMSDINVSVGQQVSTGQLIGYTGYTGYATGPHLHFTVYASNAVQIVKLGSVKTRTNCAEASIPVAALNAYLNPIEYLPAR